MIEENIKQIEKEKIAESDALEDNKIVNEKNNEIVESKVKENKRSTENKISKPKEAGKVSEPERFRERKVKLSTSGVERQKASDKEKKKVPERKLKAVEEIKNLAETKKTILIASIKNLPASQFQEISKKLRGKVIIKVPKKNISFRALDSADGKEIKKLKEQIDKDIAILFSDLDSFELASELIDNKTPAKAKAGQEAPENIIVEEGPTDLIPGPAVSELGALGIQIKIENGKINIKKAKTIVKKGDKISEGAAGLMNKLNIKPFLVGFEPIMAFDTKEKKLYLDIKIDREGTLEELKTAFGKALSFAVEIDYVCEDTIKFMISRANAHEKVLDNLKEKKKEVVNTETEIKSEDKQEEGK